MAILLGVGINLSTDAHGEKLVAEKTYHFDVAEMALNEDPRGIITADHIKFLRVASSNSPDVINKVDVSQEIMQQCLRIGFAAHE